MTSFYLSALLYDSPLLGPKNCVSITNHRFYDLSCYFSDQETHGLPAKKTPLTLKETVILSTLWENGRPQIFQEFYVMFNRFAYYAERTDKVMWNSTVRNIINTKLVEQGILSQIKLSDEEKESIRKKFKNPNARSTNKYGMFYLD